MSSTSERLHGLDAVRGFALLLGVVFHATMSFLPGPQIWVVKDVASSPVMSVLFFTTHMFRMTTFFLIAGFFARLSLIRRGPADFAKDRALRIALPLVVFWPFVLGGIILGGAYGAYVATGVFPTTTTPPPPGPPLSFPLTHLWFLYVLSLLYLATAGVLAVMRRADPSGRIPSAIDIGVTGVVRSPFGPLVLATPVAVVFALRSPWLAYFGVPTPDMNLVPNLPAAVQFGLAFGLGWFLHRGAGRMADLSRHWAVHLAVAIFVTVALQVQMGPAPVISPDPGGSLQLFHASAYALGMWSWTFAVIGMGLRFLSGHSPTRRYIADSSYWIYVIHMPVVIVLQAWVSRLQAPAAIKFAIVLGIGFGIMFASYQLLVRHTALGGWLNGSRAPRRVSGRAS